MIFDFLNSWDKSKSIDWNQAQLTNWYLMENKRGKLPLAAYPTPGLSLFSAIPGNCVRAEYQYQEIAYAVVDNGFYTINSNGVYTKLGTLLTSTGICQIANIANQLMIIDSSWGYNYNTLTNTFTRVLNLNDGQIVQSVTIATSGSGYVNPTVSFTGGGGSGATGTVQFANGQISGVIITNPGMNYTAAPTVVFSDSVGTGAVATANIDANSLPTALQSVTAQDEMFLVSSPNSGTIFFSNIGDGTMWNPLNFFSKDRYAENVQCIFALYGYIYVVGTDTTELYYNDGVSPWSLVSPGVIQTGTAAPYSVATATGSRAQFLQQSSAFWLAKRKGGGCQVIETRANQYYLVSKDIDYQLKKMTSISDAFAYVYEQEGQEFYVLTFPTDGYTFTYNITTQSWNGRNSYVNGNYTRHLSNCYMFAYNKQLVGDYQSGNIYYMDTDTFTENGTPIQRTLVTYPLFKEDRYLTIDRLILEWGTPTTSDSFQIYYSVDGGFTFTEILPVPTISNVPGTRYVFDRLGSSRVWVFMIQTTMEVSPIFMGAVGETRVSSY